LNRQALLLLGFALVLLWPTPRLLGSARWPPLSPVPALMLWQAIGLATGLAAVGAGAVYALGALGDSLPHALLAWWRNPSAVRNLSAGRWVALVGSALLAGYLLAVAAATTARTLRTRRRHRQLLDLAAGPLSASAAPRYGRVLDSAIAMAYCLPGLRPRLVVTSGALNTLSEPELGAVLLHERAHLSQRHDLVVLPFVAWSAALPFLPGTREARVAVALLIEMLADDVARTQVGAEPLTGALHHLGAAVAPDAALGGPGANLSGPGPAPGSVGDHALALRLLRLAAPPPPARALGWLAAAVAIALVAAPTAMLLA